MDFKGKTVLITGGASGIGKIMGRKVLERGARYLIIWDINEAGMNDVKAEFSSFKANVSGYKVDISKLGDIQENAQKVKSEIGDVDVLINNAGIVVGKYFHGDKY